MADSDKGHGYGYKKYLREGKTLGMTTPSPRIRRILLMISVEKARNSCLCRTRASWMLWEDQPSIISRGESGSLCHWIP